MLRRFFIGTNILMLIPFLLTSLSFFTRIGTRVSPYYLFRSARHYCSMRTEKGGDKYDFRCKRKSTNYNFINHNSAFNHIIGAFNGASWNLLRPFNIL